LGPHGLEEGKGKGYLASSRQYGNALLGVRHQEEDRPTRTNARKKKSPTMFDIRITAASNRK